MKEERREARGERREARGEELVQHARREVRATSRPVMARGTMISKNHFWNPPSQPGWSGESDPPAPAGGGSRVRDYVDLLLRGSAMPSACDNLMLWVDAVGGFWVCLADAVTLGQPVRGGQGRVPIMADISGQHARILRDGEGYVIDPIREVRVDDRLLRGARALEDGQRIQLGQRVRLVFRRPHALSATARLDFESPHRTHPSSDAVLLMADSCILGPGPSSHIVCRHWDREVVLYRYGEELYCRCTGTLEIDGVTRRNEGALRRDSRILGDGFSMSLEPLA